MSYGVHFLLSLLLTLLVEIPVLFVVARYLLRIKVKAKEILYWGGFVNLFSLPYLWFVFPLFISSHNYIYVGECLVVLIELVIFAKVLKINFSRSFVLSLMANFTSYLAGILLKQIL